MAFSVVCGWESGLEPAGIPSVLKNPCLDLFQNIILFTRQVKATIPPWDCCREGLNHSFCEIEESATGNANRQVEFSLLPWWDKTYMLQTVFSSHGMKLITTLSLLSLLSSMPCRKAIPTGDTFSPKYWLNNDSARNWCAYFTACCLHAEWSPWLTAYHQLISTVSSL